LALPIPAAPSSRASAVQSSPRVSTGARRCAPAMETRGSAHEWLRRFVRRGRWVALLPVHCLRSCIRHDKLDRNHANSLPDAAHRLTSGRCKPSHPNLRRFSGCIASVRTTWPHAPPSPDCAVRCRNSASPCGADKVHPAWHPLLADAPESGVARQRQRPIRGYVFVVCRTRTTRTTRLPHKL